MRSLATCSAYAAAVAGMLLLGAPAAEAQCAAGLIVNCPPAVNPQPGDVIYLYQLQENPHSRSFSLGALGSYISGSVSVSISLLMPSIFDVTGSPASASGTFDVTLAPEAANTVFAGPVSGPSATPTFRALVDADVPNLSCAQLPALVGSVTSASGSCATSLNSTVSFACSTLPELTGAITTPGSSCTTSYAEIVPVPFGGTDASTSNSARVNLNQGLVSPSTTVSTITPACNSSTGGNVLVMQLVSGDGPYTFANCVPPPAAGASFIFVFLQPTSGAAQSVSAYGNMYLFPSPYSNASPPPLTQSLSASDALFCVASSTQSMVCVPTLNFS